MKRKCFQVISAFLLVSLLNSCATVSPTPEAEQSGTVVSSVATPSVHLVLQPTPSSTVDQPWLALPSDTSIGKIAYLSNRTGLAEVWLLNPATGLEQQLTETDCSDVPYVGGRIPRWFVSGVQGFSWAPNGRRIAYLTTCTYPGQQSKLSIYDLELGSAISVTNRANRSSHPSWAPFSDDLVFSVSSWVDDVYIAKFRHGDVIGVELITHTVSLFPTWSPNGKYIAYRGPYVGLPGTGSRAFVSVVDVEWNHLTYEPPLYPFSDYPDVRDGSWVAVPTQDGLAWSNSSRYLAVGSVRGYGSGFLSLVEVTGDVAFMKSTLVPEIDPDPDFFNNLIFSPDDDILYFVSVRPDTTDALDPTEYFGTIYSVPVQDLLESKSPSIQVVSSSDQLAGYPSLSLDGKWFVYAVKVEETVEIWLQATDGTYKQRLVGDGFVNTQPAWQPLSE